MKNFFIKQKQFKIYLTLFLIAFVCAGGVVMADDPPVGITADRLIDNIITQILNPIIYLFFTIAFVVFAWGAVEFIAGAGEDKKREDGKKHLMYGLIGLFIMFSVYGIMNMLLSWISG